MLREEHVKPQTIGIDASSFLTYMARKNPKAEASTPFDQLLSTMSKTGGGGSSSAQAASAASAANQNPEGLAAGETPAVLFEQTVAASGTPANRVEMPASDRPRLEDLLSRSGYKDEDIKQILDQSTTADGNINLGSMFNVMHRFIPQEGPTFHLNVEDKPLLIQALKGLGVPEDEVNKFVEGLEVKGDRLLVKGLPSLLAKAGLEKMGQGQDLDKSVLTDLLGKLGLSQSEIASLMSKATDSQDRIKARTFLAMLQKAANQQDGEVAGYLKDLAQRAHIGAGQEGRKGSADQIRAKFIQLFENIESSVKDQGMSFKAALAAAVKTGALEDKSQESNSRLLKSDLGQAAGRIVDQGAQAAQAGLRQGLAQGQGQGRGREGMDQSALGRPRLAAAQAEGSSAAAGGTGRLGEAMTETASGARGSLPVHVVRQVAQQMVQMVAKQQTTLQLGLKPPSLGELNIEMSVKDGAVKAHLVVESVAAKQALEAGMDQLKSQLASQGLKVSQVEITINPDAQRQQAQAQEQARDQSGSGGRSFGGQSGRSGEVEGLEDDGGTAGIYQGMGLNGSISVFA